MSWDRDAVFGLLLEAGRIAVERKRSLKREFKGDRSIVTQADREIEAFFAEKLENPEAGRRLLGEETIATRDEEYLAAALSGTAYVVDPIDGTSPYAHGLPNWGISLALLEGGRIVEGAVHLPEYGEMVITVGPAVYEVVCSDPRWGGDGRWSWRELPPPRREPDPSGLLAVTQGVAKRGKVLLPNPVQVLGAAVVPLAGLVQERFVAYLGSVKLWDAAGALAAILRFPFSITVRAGGEIRRVGAEVSEETYHLDPRDRKRWAFRSDLLICHPEDEARMREAFFGTGPPGDASNGEGG